MEVGSREHVELESGEFGRDGWLFCQEGNISPQSRICVHTESWNWWHISNCRCRTDTESFRTQFFKAQISSKLLRNTFYTSKYKSFSIDLEPTCPLRCFEPILWPNWASLLPHPHCPIYQITAMYLFQKRTFTSYSFVSIYIWGWFTKGTKGIVPRQ